MKQSIHLLLLLNIFSTACQKEYSSLKEDRSITIRYDFNSDVEGTYHFVIRTDTIISSETLYTKFFSRSITVPGNSGTLTDTAKFTVYPPGNWTWTDSTATAIMRIFINNVEKRSDTIHISGYDRPTGYSITTTY